MTDAAAMTVPRRGIPAARSPRAWLVLALVLTLGLAVDLLTKTWSFTTIAREPITIDRERVLAEPTYNPVPYHPPVELLPWGLLDLHLVINRGAVFGIGADRRFVFIAFTFIALTLGLFYFAKRTSSRHHLAHVAIAIILAGGIGNLYDRIVYGVVRDFLHMLPNWHLPGGWRWPGGSNDVFPWVFNIADVMLLTGMALLLIHINRQERRVKREVEARAGDPGDPKPSLATSE